MKMYGLLSVVLLTSMICSCNCDKKENTSQALNDVVVKSAQAEDDIDMKELEAGLKYEVIIQAAADAPKPQAGQKVTVHYTGWLYDEKKEGDDKRGRKFDSSVDRRQPFSFNVGVGQVIQGWDKAVLDMSVGEKRLWVIAPDLGYGQRGAGGVIPGGATLMFEIECLDVESA